MKKFFLVPSVLLLVCCVTVGAFTLVTGEKRRPMTFYESIEAISSFDFSVDEITKLVDSISSAWGLDEDEHGDTPSTDDDLSFGGKDYVADSADNNWNLLLEGLSDVVFTLSAFSSCFTSFLKMWLYL